MSTTPNIALPELDSPPAITAELQVNEALRRLDAIVQLSVLDRDLASPPGSPTQGDRYLVASSPTGAWSGQAGKVAYFSGTAWAFVTIADGWRLWVADEGILVVNDGGTLKRIGIQAAAVADLGGTPSTTDLKNKVNELLAALRASGLLGV